MNERFKKSQELNKKEEELTIRQKLSEILYDKVVNKYSSKPLIKDEIEFENNADTINQLKKETEELKKIFFELLNDLTNNNDVDFMNKEIRPILGDEATDRYLNLMYDTKDDYHKDREEEEEYYKEIMKNDSKYTVSEDDFLINTEEITNDNQYKNLADDIYNSFDLETVQYIFDLKEKGFDFWIEEHEGCKYLFHETEMDCNQGIKLF